MAVLDFFLLLDVTLCIKENNFTVFFCVFIIQTNRQYFYNIMYSKGINLIA